MFLRQKWNSRRKKSQRQKCARKQQQAAITRVRPVGADRGARVALDVVRAAARDDVSEVDIALAVGHVAAREVDPDADPAARADRAVAADPEAGIVAREVDRGTETDTATRPITAGYVHGLECRMFRYCMLWFTFQRDYERRDERHSSRRDDRSRYSSSSSSSRDHRRDRDRDRFVT